MASDLIGIATKQAFANLQQHYENAEARIAALEAENARLREALEWYGEQSRLARLIHSGGDPGRHAIAADGGKRAHAALS